MEEGLIVSHHDIQAGPKKSGTPVLILGSVNVHQLYKSFLLLGLQQEMYDA